MLKLAVVGLVSTIRDDVDRTRYAHLARLVRADGIGEWTDVLDSLVTGPTVQLLPSETRVTQVQLTKREPSNAWQHKAVTRLNECLVHLDVNNSPVSDRVQLRRWFRDFATLRNATRGHGASRPSAMSLMCPPLEESLNLMQQYFALFHLPWAYIHQNLSGKYRVTYWGNSSQRFEDLKRRTDVRIPNGVYLDSGELHQVELMDSDAEATDVWIANGKFNDNNYELLSYTISV